MNHGVNPILAILAGRVHTSFAPSSATLIDVDWQAMSPGR